MFFLVFLSFELGAFLLELDRCIFTSGFISPSRRICSYVIGGFVFLISAGRANGFSALTTSCVSTSALVYVFFSYSTTYLTSSSTSVMAALTCTT